MKSFGETVALALALVAIAALFSFGHCGCRGPEQAGATAAESAYTGALLRCVDDARTLAESRACRQRVDAEWGITEREAGAR
jgi:hypothetical protein